MARACVIIVAMLSADDVLQARFAATKFRPGYDQVEVDDLLDRVADALRTGGDVADLGSVRLTQTQWREGYDIAEVDAFLDEARVSLAAPRPVVPPGQVDEPPRPRPTGLALVRTVLVSMLVGEPPEGPPRPIRPSRAARASAKRVMVTRDGVAWRARGGREGRLAVAEIARVATMRLEYASSSSSGPLVGYALVVDHAGGVRLRVSHPQKSSSDFWEPLGVPVTQERFVMGRPKDARRRWPEAFSWFHAYPFVTVTLAAVGWMLVVVPVLDWVYGV
ncbi:DivIVA domain-containing protein [Cellulomonas humilata]|uniref:DivIVA domain-containing protein n=1 Tax=Cellulomonas humilata TaxID=144055 RepID=A0A7Y6A5R3_9CELL|nr:DivIVA domain-containing protein [Cellulomonas humilata]NUU19380.1 DivIVA domain-containing protein [Cellulomonas humilata]